MSESSSSSGPAGSGSNDGKCRPRYLALAAFILPGFALFQAQPFANILKLFGIGGFFGLRRAKEIFRCALVGGHIVILWNLGRTAAGPSRRRARALFLLVAARIAACHLDLRAGRRGRCSRRSATVFLWLAGFAVAADLAFGHGFLLVW